MLHHLALPLADVGARDHSQPLGSVRRVNQDQGITRDVNGTTFAGIYEVVGLNVELTSLEFGDRSSPMTGEKPEVVAGRMLRAMAEEAMEKTPDKFTKDNAPR